MSKKNIANLLDNVPASAVRLQAKMRGNPEVLAFIRKLIAGSSAHLLLSPEVLNDVKLAITEACTNVIRHAYNFDTMRTFELDIIITPDYFLLGVIYLDPGFNPDDIPTPNLKEVKEGGLGVFIIKKIMDEVSYTIDSDSGLVVLRMLKYLSQDKTT